MLSNLIAFEEAAAAISSVLAGMVETRLIVFAFCAETTTRKGYTSGMPRAALLALLVASVLNGSLQGQRAGTAFHGGVGRPGLTGQHGFPGRPFPGHGFLPGGVHGRARFGSVFFPYSFLYEEPFAYDRSDFEAVPDEPAPAVVVQRTPAPPVPKAQVIEIPSLAGSPAARALPPAVFILANGERLQTRRFVLTANLLSVSIDRQRRTVPPSMLDISATIAANRERGIDLRIPDDRNEISVGF